MFALKWKERKKKSKIYLIGVDGGGGKWRQWYARPRRGGGGGRRGEEDTRRWGDPKWLLCTSPQPNLSNLYGRQFLGAGKSTTRPWKSVSRGGW